MANRLFELRTYYAHPGKLNALHARFRDHTNRLFARHGMVALGYWNPCETNPNEERLVYLLAYPSREAAKASWDAFRADPDWIQAKAQSEQAGPLVARIVSEFLNPTDFSPIQ